MKKSATQTVKPVGGTVQLIPRENLIPNPWNKRHWCKRDADDTELCALRDSIERSGQIQRVVVRLGFEPNTYQIVCGERRWRAIRLSKNVTNVACELYDLTDEEAFAFCMSENERRKNKEPIEVADSIQAWMGTHPEWNLDDTAAHMGISRATAARRLQLSQLTPIWRNAISDVQHWASGWGAMLLERVAALPPETQDRFIKLLDEKGQYYTDSPRISLLKSAIGKITRSLDNTFFSLTDGAHPCSACIKRASCQPDLWTDQDMDCQDDDYEDDDCDLDRAESAAKGDICLDGQCYDAKLGAAQKEKIIELSTQHPNLVVLLEYGDKEQPWMGRTGKYYNYQKGKKNDSGAIPTIKLDNLGGKVLWMTTGRNGSVGGSSKKTDKAEKGGQTVSLAQKRANLDKTRWRIAAAELERDLNGMLQQPDTLPLMDTAKIVALAHVAGTDHMHGHDYYGNHDFWTKLEDASLNSAHALDGLYLDCAKVVVRRFHALQNFKDADAEREVRGACAYFNLDVTAYWENAVETKPEPRSWSKASD